MKKIIILLLLLISVPAQAEVLTGGVKYSVEDAKIELLHNRPNQADYLLTQNNFIDKDRNANYFALLKGKTDFKDRILAMFSDGSYAVNYKNDLKHVWYYDKDGTLINSEERTSLEYPYRSYKFSPDGELVNMTLRVSEKETFIFSPFGELLGHWVGNNCYDENGNIVMTREIVK